MVILRNTLDKKHYSKDIAIDLGTANTRIYVKGEGVVLDEPSVVAVHAGSGAVFAVGREAREMVGRSPSYINVMRPLSGGVSSDFEVTEKMLHCFIRFVSRKHVTVRPLVLISVPADTTKVEQRAVEEAAIRAGARAVYIIEEPLAAAIGAGLPVNEPFGNFIVDMGAGTTEVALISLGGIVLNKSIRIGGDHLNHSIIENVRRYYQLLIGEPTAEELKITIGSTYPLDSHELSCEITGLDTTSGLPLNKVINESGIRDFIEEPVTQIVETVKNALDETPPEMTADIIEQGIVLSGGGAMLRGINERLSKETGLPVFTAERPDRRVVSGVGRCLEQFENMKTILL